MAWSKSTRISVMLGIDIAFFLLELVAGLVVGSLALMADAFHMLNDIISLCVGLWAVKAAQKSSSDKYSFGWLRAEILGAFFNAVFLIALCVSIVLEAMQRLIDPPVISNPMLILIVGCMGLVSNLAGFFVLGGHGHSHGAEGEDHGHSHGHSHNDELGAAEEGQSRGTANIDDSFGSVGDILPEAVVAKAKGVEQGRHIKFTVHDETASTSHGSDASVSRPASRQSKQHRRRSSIRNSRLANIDDLSIYPSSFRKEIIAASRPQLDGIQSEDGSATEEEALDTDVDDVPTETSPLITKARDAEQGHGDHVHSHDGEHSHHHAHAHSHSGKERHDSVHAGHNHNKPKKESKGHGGHNHADMGMRAMVLHVIGDALGNVGVIVSALIIWLTTSPYRFYADPAVSLFITLIILKSTIPLTGATAKILLQATPDHLDVNDIKEDIQGIPGVVSCHHVHIWQLSDSQVIASMHIQLSFPISEEGGSERYMELAKTARKCLHAYNIHSATIQPEFCLDKSHDHGDAAGFGYDGDIQQDSDDCLLECVDDCQGKGCCKPASADSE
ncbi:MAG: hypothetical protein M1818_005683 [Claussenomyces sp. TS43310]|nr:MAG: hypothetical protein M1818_005683 [Claussenomyces sp. TS43310]